MLALVLVSDSLIPGGAGARLNARRAARVVMAASEAPRQAEPAPAEVAVSDAADGLNTLLVEEPVVNAVSIEGDGATVALRFEDGLHCRFHSLWLRDSCRDDEHVAHFAGERLLTATPVGPSGVQIDKLRAVAVDHSDDGREVHLTWSESSIGPHELAVDPPLVSTFPAAFLRSYAELVAEPIDAAPTQDVAATVTLTDDLAWLQPFSGFDGAPAQARSSMHVWPNDGPVDLPVLSYDDVLDTSSSANLQMLQNMAKYGAAIVDGCPEPGVESLHRARPKQPGTAAPASMQPGPLPRTRLPDLALALRGPSPTARVCQTLPTRRSAGCKRTRRGRSPTGRSSASRARPRCPTTT